MNTHTEIYIPETKTHLDTNQQTHICRKKTHEHIYIYVSEHIYRNIHIYIHIHIHTDRHIHTQTQTHIYPYTEYNILVFSYYGKISDNSNLRKEGRDFFGS